MRMALIGSIPTGGIRVCQDQVGTGKQHGSGFARHANTVIAAIEPAVAKCSRLCAMAVRKIRSAGAISGQVPPDHVGRGIHLGRLALLRHRAKHVRAKVVPGNSGRLFDSQAVVSSDRSTPAGPLPHQGGLNVNALSKGALAACLLDRNSNWAVHASTIALLLRICNSVARGGRRTV